MYYKYFYVMIDIVMGRGVFVIVTFLDIFHECATVNFCSSQSVFRMHTILLNENLIPLSVR